MKPTAEQLAELIMSYGLERGDNDATDELISMAEEILKPDIPSEIYNIGLLVTEMRNTADSWSSKYDYTKSYASHIVRWADRLEKSYKAFLKANLNERP